MVSYNFFFFLFILVLLLYLWGQISSCAEFDYLKVKETLKCWCFKSQNAGFCLFSVSFAPVFETLLLDIQLLARNAVKMKWWVWRGDNVIIISKTVSMWQFEWTELCREDAIGGLFIEARTDGAGVWALVILIPPPFIDKLKMKKMRWFVQDHMKKLFQGHRGIRETKYQRV